MTWVHLTQINVDNCSGMVLMLIISLAHVFALLRVVQVKCWRPATWSSSTNWTDQRHLIFFSHSFSTTHSKWSLLAWPLPQFVKCKSNVPPKVSNDISCLLPRSKEITLDESVRNWFISTTWVRDTSNGQSSLPDSLWRLTLTTLYSGTSIYWTRLVSRQKCPKLKLKPNAPHFSQ